MKNSILNVNTVEWIKSAGIRAIKTAAQAALAVTGTTALITEIDWRLVILSAISAGVFSLITSLVGIPEVQADKDSEVNDNE